MFVVPVDRGTPTVYPKSRIRTGVPFWAEGVGQSPQRSVLFFPRKFFIFIFSKKIFQIYFFQENFSLVCSCIYVHLLTEGRYRSIKPSMKLTIDQKDLFVHNLVLGMDPRRALAELDTGQNLQHAAQTLIKDPYVADLLQAYKDEFQKRIAVDRDKLTEMAMDTYDVAKVQSDARGMIQVVKELGDIHGLHKPQEIKVTRTNEIGRNAINAVRRLTEGDLLELAGPLDDTILEAEFVELENK